MSELLNIGFKNAVPKEKVVAILAPSSAPMKRLKEGAKDKGLLLDATQGKKTRAVIVTESNHIILSAIQSETLIQRYEGKASDEF
ncbi:MAG TPA: DUF370 domain-containing protein [Firmicutes bacterium]|jgi:hypothetical protein|nr:DUF370 domain-containing protein [Bacillota bacterium]